MATTYTIKSGYSFDGKSPNGEKIAEVARKITVEQIRNKAVKFGVFRYAYEDDLVYYINKFKAIPSSDMSVRVLDDRIVCATTGTGHDRATKEIVRRAFCILVVEKCFQFGLSVSLEIT